MTRGPSGPLFCLDILSEMRLSVLAFRCYDCLSPASEGFLTAPLTVFLYLAQLLILGG